MNDDILINAHAVSRNFGTCRAIDNISMQIKRGEILGLLGANGAGKSTFMKMLAGTLTPHAGQIEILGHDIQRAPRAAKAQLGYLPEHPPLYLDFTVDEALRFAGSLHGLKDPRLTTALEHAKNSCNLQALGSKLIGDLSKGNQQRVGIAQAIIHSPQVIILDEPTVGLDPNQIRAIRDLIRLLGETRGVVLSTHLLPEVQSLCQRVTIIHQGQVVLDTPLAELAGGEDIEAILIRSPGIERLREIPGTHEVTQLSSDRYLFKTTQRDTLTDALTHHAVTENWGLRALIPLHTSLETRFVQLTCGDPSTTISEDPTTL